jgi:hypothetical protein
MITQVQAMSNISQMTDFIKETYGVTYENLCNSRPTLIAILITSPLLQILWPNGGFRKM